MKIGKKGALASEIAEMVGQNIADTNYMIEIAGVVGVITKSGKKYDIADFATALTQVIRSGNYERPVGLIDLTSLADQLVSPIELLGQAQSIGFVQSKLLGGIQFWNTDELAKFTDDCDTGFITVRKLASWSSLTIPQLSTLVINEDLPRIKPRCFVPGWDTSALSTFLKRIDINPVCEASEFDVGEGRIYELLDAPEPLHALDAVALQQAYFGQVGHPLQLADGSFGWVAQHVNELIYGPRYTNKDIQLSQEALDGLTRK